ncbi:MAG: MBL fold metallo-hydrolase [Candidatus Magasanikbacteria bacterium]|nr:MBL fold metallo-hydrolase [Candidatus Magasanikbacteria bacterium]
MHISWLGGTTVKIVAKPFDEEVVIVIDPYKPAEGTAPRSLSPQVALFTRGSGDSITLSGEPFILDTPGECDIKGVLITSVAGAEGQTMIRLDAEGVSLAHLGLVNKSLNQKQREVLSDVDVLFVPVGGVNTYDAEDAVKAVNELEARVIIPIAHQSDNDPKAAPVAQFCKAMGVPAKDGAETKVIIKKKDLPTEDTSVIVLAKE